MANVQKNGFWPINESSARCRRYEVVSGNTAEIMRGDLVSAATAGTVQQTAAGDTTIVGVVRGVSYVRDGKREERKYLPATTTYSPTARGSINATYVWVFDDPMTEFVGSVASHANTDTAAEVYAALFDNMDVVVGTSSTVYGWSGMQLAGALAGAAANLRLLEILRSPDNDLASAHWRCKFLINEHIHPVMNQAGV